MLEKVAWNKTRIQSALQNINLAVSLKNEKRDVGISNIILRTDNRHLNLNKDV